MGGHVCGRCIGTFNMNINVSATQWIYMDVHGSHVWKGVVKKVKAKISSSWKCCRFICHHFHNFIIIIMSLFTSLLRHFCCSHMRVMSNCLELVFITIKLWVFTYL